jgi:hypothetical protein
MVPDNAAEDRRNLERFIASDLRFDPRLDRWGQWRIDFHDPRTGERQVGLLQYEAVRLKAELDANS